MQLRAPGPRRAPVFPALERRGDFLEVGEQDAVRYEARGPMRNCRSDLGIFGHATLLRPECGIAKLPQHERQRVGEFQATLRSRASDPVTRLIVEPQKHRSTTCRGRLE